MLLFERYVTLLEKQFGSRFSDVSSRDFVRHMPLLTGPQIISQDELLPMYIEQGSERDDVLGTVWLRKQERDSLIQCVFPPLCIFTNFGTKPRIGALYR